MMMLGKIITKRGYRPAPTYVSARITLCILIMLLTEESPYCAKEQGSRSIFPSNYRFSCVLRRKDGTGLLNESSVRTR